VKEGHAKGLGTISYHFYSRPTQLMKFGDRDYHPNTDWQDLFFDLLFVGGAYQTGNFLVNGLIADDGEKLEAILWAFCIFTTLAQQWLMKILLGSRFSHSSMFHYLLDNVEFILLAFAMWHIPASPLNVKIGDYYSSSYSSYGDDSRRFLAAGSDLSTSSGEYKTISCLDQLKDNTHGRTGGFSISLALVSLLYLFKWLEIFTDKNATVGARTIARYSAQGFVATFCFMILAFKMCNDYGEYVLWIWMASNCAYVASLFRWVFFMRGMKAKDRLIEAGVPMSTNYFIQRVGEFCMLIIGESVLSLLALSVEADHENYLMFGASALIACNLYFHHFSTYPADPSYHVLRDGTFNFDGCCYTVALIYFYPYCVVHIGVCLKALLAQADNKGPLTFVNWAIAIGICCEYILISIFVYFHFRSRTEGQHWQPFSSSDGIKEFIKNFILKTLSMFLILVFVGIGLEPFPMVMSCCVGLFIQSVLILYLKQSAVVNDDDKDEELEIAARDYQYQLEKLENKIVTRSSSFDSGVKSLQSSANLFAQKLKARTSRTSLKFSLSSSNSKSNSINKDTNNSNNDNDTGESNNNNNNNNDNNYTGMGKEDTKDGVGDMRPSRSITSNITPDRSFDVEMGESPAGTPLDDKSPSIKSQNSKKLPKMNSKSSSSSSMKKIKKSPRGEPNHWATLTDPTTTEQI
jgi:hypothetical protein